MKRPEILKTITDELAKLGPKDEVAILAMDLNGEDEKRVWLSNFTRDPAQLASALMRAPQFVDIEPEQADAIAAKHNQENNSQGASVTVNSGSSDPESEEPPPPPPLSPSAASNDAAKAARDQIVRTDVIKGKDGATITRTVKASGAVDIKRVDKNGNIKIEISDIYDMAAAVQDTIHKTQTDRPNSQLSIIWVSDGIVPIFHEDRAATEQLVLR